MVSVRVRFSVWLVSCYAHVFVLLQVVIVTLPVIFTVDVVSSLHFVSFKQHETDVNLNIDRTGQQ